MKALTLLSVTQLRLTTHLLYPCVHCLDHNPAQYDPDQATRIYIVLLAALTLFSPTTGLQISSLDPATHAYSFWEGVPIDAKCAFGALFAASRTLKVHSQQCAVCIH